MENPLWRPLMGKAERRRRRNWSENVFIDTDELGEIRKVRYGNMF